MKAAIVTGASGFIGANMCKSLLEKGVKVYGIVRNKGTVSHINHPLYQAVEADFSTYNSLPELIKDEIDVFYHIAWGGTYGSSLGDYEQQINNIKYTCDALTAAHKIGCKKFIIAGTINEFEALQLLNAEENRPRLACIYGVAKLSCDFMCKVIATNLGIDFNTAIIGSCFGPGDTSRRIHNVFISNMLKGSRPKLVEADVLYDWVYVGDVADMLYTIGVKGVNMKNYYLGHNKLKKLKDILIEVRDILNPGLELVFGELKDTTKVDYSLVDINAIYEDTGYVCNSDFKECILKTAEWVKEQKI